MPTLFVLSHAPHSDTNEGQILCYARDGDTVLLIEDAVYAAGLIETPLTPIVTASQARGISVFALEPDCAARGIASVFPTVDYSGFVGLITDHDRAVH